MISVVGNVVRSVVDKVCGQCCGERCGGISCVAGVNGEGERKRERRKKYPPVPHFSPAFSLSFPPPVYAMIGRRRTLAVLMEVFDRIFSNLINRV